MRNLDKGNSPQVLVDNSVTWLNEWLVDKGDLTKKYRYRHPAIKTALRTETGFKCIYCESKIGHNTPGDIEHKLPSSKRPDQHFTWENLTIACTECNRRKNDYYDADGQAFLDPYTEDVEAQLQHLGPIVLPRPGCDRAEITLRTLELHNGSRAQLLGRKIEKIEEVCNLTQRIHAAAGPLRHLLMLRLQDMVSRLSEYSGMVLAQASDALPHEQWK